jgi:glycerophosphoryl diester phosphodiesterase
MPPRPPLIIAHRGASGYLPEHTLEAKALAYGQGADYLEQDVVATRDGELVVLHDTYLDDVTDVAERFGGRQRDDGHYYVVDFELAELAQLRVFERRRPGRRQPLFPGRFPPGAGRFRIATLADEIALVQGLNRSTGRQVGIYPELKDPAWHRRNGIDLSALLLERLRTDGYRRREDPVFVQCFDAAELQRWRSELATPLRLVQLLDDSAAARRRSTPEGLGEIAAYADAVGIPYPWLLAEDAAGGLRDAPLAADVRAAGLELHAYTFRADRPVPAGVGFDALLAFMFTQVRVSAIFCDQPDVAVAARSRLDRPDKLA